jgi:hypothetical protein
VANRLPIFAYALLLAAVGAAAAYFISARINEPLVADEPQFVDVAASLAAEARPMAYSGSTYNAVVSHPLLYHSLLAAPVAFAGKAPWAARLVGALALFGAAALLWFAAREVTAERWAPALAVGLFLLHPLALQSALLVEIDTAVLPLFAAAFLFFLARRRFELGGRGWLAFGLLAGLSLMAKLTTTPLLLLALAAFYVVRWRPRQLLYLAAAAAVAAAAFAAYYLPLGLLRGLPLAEPFAHSFARGLEAGALSWPLLLKRGLRLGLWLGVPFAAAFFLTFAQRARRRFRDTPDAMLFALVAAAAVLIFYLVVGGDGYGFVKYHAPMMPLAAFALAVAWGPALAKESKWTLLFLGAAAFAFYLLVVRDPLYWPYIAREAREVYLSPPGEVNKALALTGAFVLLPLPAFVVMTRRGGRTASFVILAAVASPALDCWQLRAPYEVRYNYGERGFKDAVAEVAAPADMTIVVPVDVAFAEGYRRRHVAVEDLLGDRDAFYARVVAADTAVVVLRDSYYLHAAYKDALTFEPTVTALETYYDISRRGSFAVAVRKTVPFDRVPVYE